MLDLYKLETNERLCRSTIGCSWSEVTKLLPPFRKAEKIQQAQQVRVRRVGGGAKPKVLDTSMKRLIFILYYLKNYPTYDQLGMQFDMNRSRCWKWVKKLTPIISLALDKEIPKPKGRRIEKGSILSQTQIGELGYFAVDATEQPIQRPKKNQGVFYSGKKSNTPSKDKSA